MRALAKGPKHFIDVVLEVRLKMVELLTGSLDSSWQLDTLVSTTNNVAKMSVLFYRQRNLSGFLITLATCSSCVKAMIM